MKLILIFFMNPQLMQIIFQHNVCDGLWRWQIESWLIIVKHQLIGIATIFMSLNEKNAPSNQWPLATNNCSLALTLREVWKFQRVKEKS